VDIALDHSLLLSVTLPELQACLLQLCPPALTHGTTVLAFQPSSRLVATLQRLGCPHFIAAWVERLAKEWLRLPPALLGSTEPLGEEVVGAQECDGAVAEEEEEKRTTAEKSGTRNEAAPDDATSTGTVNAAMTLAPNLLHLLRSAGARSAIAALGDGFARFNGKSDDDDVVDDDGDGGGDEPAAWSAEEVLLSTAHPRGWVPNPSIPGGWLRHQSDEDDGRSSGNSSGTSSGRSKSTSTTTTVESYPTTALVEALLPCVPRPLSGGLGLVELVLANGMKVAYKYNDRLDDEVLLSGYAPGGLTQALPLLEAAFPDPAASTTRGEKGEAAAAAAAAPAANSSTAPLSEAVLKQRRAAMFALRHGTAIASLFGLYGLPLADVEDALAGQRVALQCELGLYARSVSGDCSPQDLVTQLRLIHLAFTAQVCAVVLVYVGEAKAKRTESLQLQ